MEGKVMDLKRIASRVAAEPDEAEPNLGVQVDFSLHGMVSVNVRVSPDWLSEDGDLLPEYEEKVRQLGRDKADEIMQGVPDQVRWQLEDM